LDFLHQTDQKKAVLKLRSVNNIVIAPANTGKLVINKIAVKIIDHKNNDKRSTEKIFLIREHKIVVKKLILPKIEETPAKCNLKIARSTEIPLWNPLSAKGGYTVHPVPPPESTIEDNKSNLKEGISSQNDKLFIRGNTISATPNINGISQLPNPPIEMGIVIKKIMTKACAVTKTL